MNREEARDLFRRLKVCVLIPTYNNAGTVGNVVRGVLDYTDQVIVVNDGSTDSALKVLGEFTVDVVSYSQNRGKGYALRQGFARAVTLGFDYAIAIDSDGQHFPDDLPHFLAAIQRCPGALVIGARNMDQSSVPGKSSFGNSFSNFWFRVETGLRVNDTQSGYRLYPVKALMDFRFFTRKYEFEIEVLVRAAWEGIRILEVPVKVYYPEKNERVSHFRPFRDFTRISILNTFLVLIAFFYIKPRDLLRDIKKKTSGRSSTSTCSTRMNPIL
jgi:glycosyltransferase involved in cell wall biosynthesis